MNEDEVVAIPSETRADLERCLAKGVARMSRMVCPRRAEGPVLRGLPDHDRWERNRWGTRLSRWWERVNSSDGALGWLYDRLRGHARHGGTRWQWRWQPRSCSYCGCVHPDDARQLVREGWVTEGTTKGYKFYLYPPGNAFSPVPPVKGYVQHFCEPGQSISRSTLEVVK